MTNTNLVFGVTGMPGSGKSFLCDLLCSHYGTRIDSDKIGHEVLGNKNIQKKLVNAFGADILNENEIDRKILSKRVFSTSKIQILNSICHPLIKQILKKELQKKCLPGEYKVVEIPLLFEAKFNDLCTYTICVESSFNTRFLRVSSHRNWSKNELRKRDACQNETLKKEAADILINGEASIKELKNEINRFIIAVRYNSILWFRKKNNIDSLKKLYELSSGESNLIKFS
jgi:dephospho-CoA kinase